MASALLILPRKMRTLRAFQVNGGSMGQSHFISYLLDAVLTVFEVCGLIVFLAWVIARAWREIRDIFRGGTP
jgi:hypothetical protein